MKINFVWLEGESLVNGKCVVLPGSGQAFRDLSKKHFSVLQGERNSLPGLDMKTLKSHVQA